MATLASDLRKTLENTVVEARDKAERGAREALTALAVGASEPFSSMGDDERKLRNRLRAHGRQLGDQRDPQKGTQSIECLVREMAYEHWHRMLFARFLAENQLLIEPTSGVAISLDECEELAAEEGTDLWELAAQFAQEMLPQIFRVDDPVLAAKLPLEIRQQLQRLVADLEEEVFTASDSLGWTYQFWQSKQKGAVNERVKSGDKVGAEEIPPLTQLFTEEYMVEFILDNTIGSWFAHNYLAANPELRSRGSAEEIIRQLAIDGCEWSYLRLHRDSSGDWAPLLRDLDEWPKQARYIKCLDPCMGSGHFIVAFVDRLVALRAFEENISPKDALYKVLADNVFGLELDPRCTQIAIFNLALYAWKRFGYIQLHTNNLACSGLAPNLPMEQWVTLALGSEAENDRLKSGLIKLYQLYSSAAERGSLINPLEMEADVFSASYPELVSAIKRVIDAEAETEDAKEVALAARGMSAALRIMLQDFVLVATNPPYLGQLKQRPALRRWVEKEFFDAKSDLSMSAYSRMINYCRSGGTAAAVLPGEITYQKRLSEFRKRLLKSYKIDFIALLGSGAFRTPLRVQPCLISCTKSRPNPKSLIAFIETAGKEISEKDSDLRDGVFSFLEQASQLNNPDNSIRGNQVEGLPLLSEYVDGLTGLTTGASDQFVRKFWEVNNFSGEWELMQSSIDGTDMYSGFSLAILWENEAGCLAKYADSVKHLNHVAQNWRRGKPSWGKSGVAISKMGGMGQSPYFGAIYNANCCALIPKRQEDLPALWCFANSGKYAEEVRKINKALLVETKYLTKVPVDIDFWRELARREMPEGLPPPNSERPTQWLFNGNPKCARHTLQVLVCRLLGYKWPIEYTQGLPFSGGSIDSGFLDQISGLVDQDGIVCLQAVRGEPTGVERLKSILGLVYGEEWSRAKERELLLEAAVDSGSSKPAKDLGDWLRNQFFAEHCRVFQSRPFIWHIWDGNPTGFSALVNYHKLAANDGLGRKLLESLAYSYLGDWIDRQNEDVSAGEEGAEGRLNSAQLLQAELVKVLEGEPPYDLFIRWKPLHQQPIGWNPDINDGVRLNIRPFASASIHRVGARTAQGILRTKIPNLDWARDRGKEPLRNADEFPWYWGYSGGKDSLLVDFGAPVDGSLPAAQSFDGIRWNDLHYTRVAKEAARARYRGES